MSCESDTAAVLRAAGQRVTPQRILILGCVRHAGGHVTAAQILDEVRRSFPYIDASTVYRTLAAAKERRLVSEVNLGGGEDLFEQRRQAEGARAAESLGVGGEAALAVVREGGVLSLSLCQVEEDDAAARPQHTAALGQDERHVAPAEHLQRV